MEMFVLEYDHVFEQCSVTDTFGQPYNDVCTSIARGVLSIICSVSKAVSKIAQCVVGFVWIYSFVNNNLSSLLSLPNFQDIIDGCWVLIIEWRNLLSYMVVC